MSRLPRSGGAAAAGWGCLPSLFGGCGVAGSAFSPKAELTRSTAGGSGCSLVALVAGSLRDGLPWAVGRRVRYIMTWAGNLHRWPRRSSPSPPPLLWTLSRDRSGRWGWVGLDRLHGLRLGVVGLLVGVGGWWWGWVGLVRLWRRLACSAPAPSFLLSRWPASLPVRARAAPRCRLALLLLACGVALPSQVGRLGAGLV